MINVERLSQLTAGQPDTTPSAAPGMKPSARAARSATDRQTRFPEVAVDPDGVMLWKVEAGPHAGDWIASLEPDGAWLVIVEASNGMGGAWVLPMQRVEAERQPEAMRRWLSELVGPRLAARVALAWENARATGG